MNFAEEFKRRIFEINEKNIVDSSLDAFEFQYKKCAIYQEYCNYLKINPKKVKAINDIPFLPIEFFKSHTIKSGRWKESKVFKSSGTTSTGRSKHFVKDLNHYQTSSIQNFEEIFGSISAFKIVALLPSYQEQGDSSLISMVDYFIKNAADGSGYFLDSEISDLLENKEKKLLIGVSYALLDLAEKKIPAHNAVVMETGGMKGRRKEMTRTELHQVLRDSFGVEEVWSEYGMTELLTQAYGRNGYFQFPKWAKCLIRDINDPLSYLEDGKTGGINVIDLANIDTCCFIETKDLGRIVDNTFEVLGRFDNSDIRGCNLLI
ncbi:MAG: acyl transferase [Ekhidna sp.]|uniref:LuxE/PaaK family acyltransferase n=1 Tax=Ekhidna sp. TaxID=2608089 RepID=UPI0032F06F7C